MFIFSDILERVPFSVVWERVPFFADSGTHSFFHSSCVPVIVSLVQFVLVGLRLDVVEQNAQACSLCLLDLLRFDPNGRAAWSAHNA